MTPHPVTPVTHSKALEVVQEIEEGVSTGLSIREVAEGYGMAEPTIRHLCKVHGVVPAEYIDRLLKATGVEAMRFSMLAFERLTQRLVKGEKIQPAQLAVMAGIGASRGRELLDKPTEIPPPDWSTFTPPDITQDPQSAGERVVVQAE